MWKISLYILGAVLFVAVGLLAVRYWAVSHLNLSGVGYVIQTSPVKAADAFITLAQEVREGKLPSRRVDLLSVGAPAQEHRLLDLRHFYQVFRLAFGTPPQSARL